MNLLKKAFNKNDEKQEVYFFKDDIFVYAECLQEPVLKKNKDYVLIGVYNEDRTQFTDLGNDKVYTFEKTIEDVDVVNFNGRKMFKIGNYVKREVDDKVYALARIKTNTKYEESGFAWVNPMVVGFHYHSDLTGNWEYSPKSKEFDVYMDFLFKCGSAKVLLSELKTIGQTLNNYAYDAVLANLQEQENVVDKNA